MRYNAGMTQEDERESSNNQALGGVAPPSFSAVVWSDQANCDSRRLTDAASSLAVFFFPFQQFGLRSSFALRCDYDMRS